MKYPGRLIKVGEKDPAVVKALRAKLNKLLAFGPGSPEHLDEANSAFNADVSRMVKFFQSRSVDANGRELKADGVIGAITWAVLFGDASVPQSAAATDALLARVLAIAGKEADQNVREVPPNSNLGARVEAYQKRAGSPKGLAWCCSFTYWCFDDAAIAMQKKNPMVKTAGCIDHWTRAAAAGAVRIKKADAIADASLVKAGMIFIMSHGKGLGHTGFVESVNGGLLSTIEGNTDASKSREGGGVYRLQRKSSDSQLLGFIDYSGR